MHKSKIIKFVQIFLLIIYLTDVSYAYDFSMSDSLLESNNTHDNIQGENHEEDDIYYLDPTDEAGITKALRNHKHVHLRSGEYLIDDSVQINSNNILSGEPDAIIRVKSTSSQFFQGSKGLIYTKGYVDNVEIYGFKIDGSCDKLPFEYHHSRPDTAHDCERAIVINGQTGRFSTNIKIHDLEIKNCFSDGIHVRMAIGVHCYNNYIENCQHEGIFWVSVKDGIAENNKIAGITSDCFRTDNGVNNLIQNNYFLSYTGDKNSNAPKGWNNGIQIADAGASHGYDASKKPTSTTNIEVRGNVFANIGLRAVWLDSTGKGYDNVYIHDNEFANVKAFTNPGKSVTVDIEATNERTQQFIDLTDSITPSVETSKSIFDSIFNVLNIKYVDSGVNKLTENDIRYELVKTEKGKIAGGVKIVGFSNLTILDNETYISGTEDVIVKSSVVRNPSLDGWVGTINDIDKDIHVSIENGTATATMDVSVTWSTPTKKSKTGKLIKGKLRTNTYTFEDYCPAPDILPRPSNTTGTIFEFKSKEKHYTLVSVDPTGLQRVVYEYDGNKTEHVFMMGEKGEDENGISKVKFYSMNYWNGDLPHYADSAFINGTFDQSKLNVTAYTIYEEIPVSLSYEYEEWDGTAFSDSTKYQTLKILILIFALWKLLKIPKF